MQVSSPNLGLLCFPGFWAAVLSLESEDLIWSFLDPSNSPVMVAHTNHVRTAHPRGGA